VELGFHVLGFRVQALGLDVLDLWFMVYGSV